MIKKKILIVVGTRPNFIKVTQFKKVSVRFPHLKIKIVHTGQHYDNKMADVFFEQFNLIPDYFLNISKGTVISQMTDIMNKLESLIINEFKANLLVVVGDVNSTLAASLVANKLSIRLAHIESGLRSFDKTMPEEHNRVLTDALADYFFVTEQSGIDNLIREGISSDKIFFVGNTMIDTLIYFKTKIKSSPILKELKVEPKKYVLITMHRPATVDEPKGLKKLMELIEWVSKDNKLIFPIHPRTLRNLEDIGLINRFKQNKNIITTEPLDYFSFQNLILNCKYVLTDSGGIQEESTYLGIPCLTLRPNTERPVTCSEGTNTLVPFDLKKIKKIVNDIYSGKYKKGKLPVYWDGKATQRIVASIDNLLNE